MPRLFAGIEIPATITTLLSMQKGGLYGARWVDESNYHITLRFIGDVDYSLANEIVFQMSQVQYPEFDLSLRGFGSFGAKKPHSVFAAVQSSEDLFLLHREIEAPHEKTGTQV